MANLVDRHFKRTSTMCLEYNYKMIDSLEQNKIVYRL